MNLTLLSYGSRREEDVFGGYRAERRDVDHDKFVPPPLLGDVAHVVRHAAPLTLAERKGGTSSHARLALLLRTVHEPYGHVLFRWFDDDLRQVEWAQIELAAVRFEREGVGF